MSEVDPFEQLLALKRVTANAPSPWAEPTVAEPHPLGWWIDPPPPPAPRPTVDMRPRSLTPPQWRREGSVAPTSPVPPVERSFARSPPRPRRALLLAVSMLLAAAALVGALVAGSRTHAWQGPLAPLPPARQPPRALVAAEAPHASPAPGTDAKGQRRARAPRRSGPEGRQERAPPAAHAGDETERPERSRP